MEERERGKRGRWRRREGGREVAERKEGGREGGKEREGREVDRGRARKYYKV